MRYLFIVQGEGRGHMTQAISLSQLLINSGHQIVAVLVGKNVKRQIPAFFYEKIGAPVRTFESPDFIMDKRNRGIHLLRSIISNAGKLKTFSASIRRIDEIVKEVEPEVIVNFYDLLTGLYYLRKKPGIPLITIGHQYLLLHPDFVFPKGRWIDKKLLVFNTWFSGRVAVKQLALSFRKMPDADNKKIKVVPPLLRDEIKLMQPLQGDFLLGYILNSGYAGEIAEWHSKNQEIKLEFFWDNNMAEEVTEVNENFHIHKINDQKFIKYMASCKAFASTAGFESICEAMYLSKPVMMIPVAGHYEQQCNALDACRVKAGITSDHFDLSGLLDHINNYNFDNQSFREWINTAETIFLEELTMI
jgi:uncharacterized protein (TIGR00661 family)